MKYCANCGNQIDDYVTICPFCGVQVMPVVQQAPETSTIGILAIVFGALGGWLGLLFGIIGLCTNKEPNNRRNCKIGIGLFCVWIVIDIIIIAVVVNLVMAAAVAGGYY